MSSSSLPLLVADVGGTNARFALADAVSVHDAATLSVAQYDTFADAICSYLTDRGLRGKDLQGASLAIASPVGPGEIRFTNSPWRFSPESIVTRFGFPRLRIVNDFEALAWQVPYCSTSALREVRPGIEQAGAPRVVLGPGTGLGVAGVVPVGTADGMLRWRPVPGEGGHVAFAPTDDFEIELLKFLQGVHGRVSVERVVSGPGLAMLHGFVARRHGLTIEPASPESISQRALGGEDPLAGETVERFLRIIGSFVGDMALTFGANGGVYLAGGILPQLEPLLAGSGFFARLDDKGRYSRWIAEIPIRLIIDDKAALRGAAMAFHSE